MLMHDPFASESLSQSTEQPGRDSHVQTKSSQLTEMQKNQLQMEKTLIHLLFNDIYGYAYGYSNYRK